jgi:hypothetical protein
LNVQNSVFQVFFDYFCGTWSDFHEILAECVAHHYKMIFTEKIEEKEKIEIFWRKIDFFGRVF